MKVTLFGLAGTGTSSTGKAVADKLGLEFLSTGNMFRAQAKELGLTINELDKLSLTDPVYDKMLDQKIADYGKNNDNFIIESRMAWFFVPDSIKIKLHCDFDTRLARVASRDNVSLDDARRLTLEREDAIFDRYARYYGVTDCQADVNFDLVIENTNLPFSEVVDRVIDFIGQQR